MARRGTDKPRTGTPQGGRSASEGTEPDHGEPGRDDFGDDKGSSEGQRHTASETPVLPNHSLPDREGGADEAPASELARADSVLLGAGTGQAARRRSLASPFGSAPAAVPGAAKPAAPEPPPGAGSKAGSAKSAAGEAPPAVPASHDIPSPPPAPPAAPRRRGGFWPLFCGGVLAAAVGAGAVWTVIPRLPPAWQPAPANGASDAGQMAEIARAEAGQAVTAATAGLRDEATQAGRAAGAEAGAEAARAALAGGAQAGGDAADLAPLTERVAELERRLAALSGGAGASAGQGTAATAPTPGDAGAPGAADAGLAAAIARARADLDQAASAANARIAKTTADLEARLTDVTARVDRISAEADTAAKRAQAAAAAARLEAVLQEGGSTAAAASAAAAAGLTPAPALPAEVPSLAALEEGFDDAARAALAAALKTEPSPGGVAGIAGFLRAQTGARSLTPRAGSDPDAVLSRAGAAVARGDIAAALDEVAQLPPAAQEAMADWTTQAKAWRDARAAADSIAPQPAATDP